MKNDTKTYIITLIFGMISFFVAGCYFRQICGFILGIIFLALGAYLLLEGKEKKSNGISRDVQGDNERR